MKQRKQNSPAFRFADTKSAMLQPPARWLSARSLVSAPPGKVTLASAARLVNALPTPPLRYQLFPGVGYFRFKGKKNGCFCFHARYARKNGPRGLLRPVVHFLPPDTRGRHTLAPTHGRKYRYRRLANTGIPLPPSQTQSPLCSGPLYGDHPPAPLRLLLLKKSRLLRLLG